MFNKGNEDCASSKSGGGGDKLLGDINKMPFPSQ